MVEYIKFVEEDHDTYPDWSGNYDTTSKEVIVCYKKQYSNYFSYSIGWTDWDGDSHYWNIKGEKNPFEVISWAYFNKE